MEYRPLLFGILTPQLGTMVPMSLHSLRLIAVAASPMLYHRASPLGIELNAFGLQRYVLVAAKK